MWSDWVLPRLRERGLGDGRLVRNAADVRDRRVERGRAAGRRRCSGRRNPVVATYARADWLDVRVSAVDEVDADGHVVRPAAALLTRPCRGSSRRSPATSGPRARRPGRTSWRTRPRAPGSASRSSRRARAAPSRVSWRTCPRWSRRPRSVRRSRWRRSRAGWWRRPRTPPAARASRSGSPSWRGTTEDGRRSGPRSPPPRRAGRAAQELRLFQRGQHGRFRAAVAAAAFLAEVLGDR